MGEKQYALKITPFHPDRDQNAARALILAGLVEHWGYLDESKNPDLNDIATFYKQGVFLIARLNDELVGTGAFLPRTENTVEVVRMSVAKHVRRQGIGRQILLKLCCKAHQNGYQRVILETTATWQNVIAFYKSFGFQITHSVGGDMYFSLDLRDFLKKHRVNCHS